MRDKSGRIHTKTLDLFPTKLGQYLIILRLLWFRKYSLHIQFDKNTVTFNFLHYLQYCSPSHQGVTISGLNTLLDHPPHLPTLSDQAVIVSSAKILTPNLYFCLWSYYCYWSYPSPHQTVNVFSIDKSTNRHSRSTSSSTSIETSVGADTSWSHNPCSSYSYNSYHHLNITDSLKTINQKLLRPKDWVLPTIADS